MHRSSLFVFTALVAVFVGCAQAQATTTTFFTLDRTFNDSVSKQYVNSGSFGWHLSWELIGGDEANFGPLNFIYNGSIVETSGVFAPRRIQNESIWSVETHSALYDPCETLKLVPQYEIITTTFQGTANVNNGTLNVTTVFMELFQVGLSPQAQIPLECSILGCGKYGLLDVVTSSNNYSVIITLSSQTNLSATVAVGPNQCPSSTGKDTPATYNLYSGKNQTLTVNDSPRQIWFHLSNYEKGTNSRFVIIDWKVVPAGQESETRDDSEIIKWALIGGAIGAAFVSIIVVIVVVIRKQQRKNLYVQVK